MTLNIFIFSVGVDIHYCISLRCVSQSEKSWLKLYVHILAAQGLGVPLTNRHSGRECQREARAHLM